MGPWLAGISPVTHTGSSIAIAAWMVLENKFIIIPGSKGHVINRRPLGLNLVDELRLSHQNAIIEEHQKCRVYIADEIPPPRKTFQRTQRISSRCVPGGVLAVWF
jgi:hypothetical protein